MNPETGRIQTKPASMSDSEWLAYCQEYGLVPMTDEEFKRLAPKKPTLRARQAATLKAFTPEALKRAKETRLLEQKRKAERRSKGKASRHARKRR